jgi:AraC family transcriptional regulator
MVEKVYSRTMGAKESSRRIFGSEVLNRKVSDFRLVDCLYPADSEMPRHTHEVSHLSLVLSGNYTERYGRNERACEAAMLIVHPPDEDHSVAFREKGARVFSLHLRPKWVERIRDYSKILDEPAAFRGLPASLAARLYREVRQWDAVTPLVIESLALQIIAETSRQVSLSEKRVPRWLERVREMLHAQFAETVRFSELAAAAEVHPVYLAREFRRHFRCTMGEYLRRLRVEIACEIISKSEMPLNEIAVRVGFYDQSHLTNACKRLTGLTPAQYRATFRSRLNLSQGFEFIQD